MPTYSQNVATSLPQTDFQVQQLALERRRQLAQALTQQSQEPLQTNEMAGGWVVPVSPYQGLNKALQAGLGAYTQNKATSDERALVQEQQQRQSNATSVLSQALTPRDATAGGALPDDQAGPPSPSQPAYTPGPGDILNAVSQYGATTGNPEISQNLVMGQAGNALSMANTAAALKQALGAANGGMAGQPSPGMAGGSQPGQGASGAPGGNGIFDLSPAQLGAFAASPNPMLQNIAKTVLEARKVTALRPGAPGVNGLGQVVVQPTPSAPPGVGINLGPNGPTMSTVPGAPQAMGQVAGAVTAATEAAKAPYTYENMPLQGGGTMPTPQTQMPGFGAAPGSMPPSVNLGAPSPSAIQPAPMPEGVPIPAKGPLPAMPAVGMNQLPAADQPAAQAVMGATANRQPLTLLGSQAQPNDPWATMPKLQLPSGIGPGTIYGNKTQNNAADVASSTAAALNTGADAANSKNAIDSQALDLLNKADTGEFGPALASMKNIIVSAVPSLANSDWNPAGSQVLYKDLTNAALAKGRNLFGSRFTNSEVGIMMNKASPSPQMAKTAIEFLLQSDQALNGYQIQQANDFGKYINQGGDPQRFSGWYSTAFPQSDALAKVQLSAPGGSPSTTPTQFTPQQLMNEMRRRGLAQ